MSDHYEKIFSRHLNFPKGDKKTFITAQERAVSEFKNNLIFKKLDQKTATMNDYHSMLLMIFHQAYNSAASFALAASNCGPKLFKARDYLIKHSGEEKDHWLWIISDLEKSGYKGADPREIFPTQESQAYLSFGYFLALTFPLGRLAMASVLEGVGGTYGKSYGQLMAEQLKLKPDQAQFFLMHGELDVGHAKEVIEVMEREEISPFEWAYLTHAAEVTGQLYKNMYDRAAKSTL